MSDKRGIVLIGGGGHCRSVLDSIISMNKYSEILITDHSLPAGSTVMGCKVAGTDDILVDLFNDDIKDAVITIGNTGDPAKRRKVFNIAKQIGFRFPIIIDPSAVVSKEAHIEEGVFVGKKAVINAGASVGAMSIINTGSIVEHDCSIGSFVHVAVGAVVCGECRIGNDSFIGSNSTVIQCRKIGERSAIGAGAVVISDIGDNCTAVGVPAKVIKEK